MTELTDSQLVKLMKLNNVHGLGPSRILYLVQRFETIDGVFNAANLDLEKTKGITNLMVKEIEKLKSASDENYLKTIHDCKKNKIEILTLFDKDYPRQLKNIPLPPIFLFLWGDKSLLYSENKIAIVGSRTASEKALDLTSVIASNLAKKGVVIVSGGALGIDTAAHNAVLQQTGGKTISIMGTGFFNLYPEENKKLLNTIKERGLLVSEYSPNFGGANYSFVQRNRITSGISNGIINIASGAMGGAMVQTKTAYKQKVPIFVPSLALHILPNEGIKQAIQEFGAIEIMSSDDVLDKLKNETNLNNK
ncbi:MAG: DNA-processing protein DprA [archaeon]|nr:DNA-processing protein DprA [archaeon]